MRRRLALTAVAAMLLGATAPHIASAATGDLACEAQAQLNFTPPLTATNTTAKVDATGGHIACTSPNGSYPNLKSSVLTASGTATSARSPNPCSLLVTIQLNMSETWSPTGQKSQGTLTIDTDLSDGKAAISAVVTSGVLAGDSATPVGAVPVPNGDCALNGRSSLTVPPNELIYG